MLQSAVTTHGAQMQDIISIRNLNKIYKSGFHALKNINLDIRSGEIFALLGPNGAGKTTLISAVCGIVTATNGSVVVDGYDNVKDFLATRSLIGLVPQELTTDAFETVWNTVTFSRGLFNKPKNPAHIEKVLKDLSLWDKRNDKILTLSGGMKRRVMIAKALSHEPRILFLDEPTAGVDVELRKSMWQMIRGLQQTGVTIVLTTHYIDEAEEMADRVGIINKGEIILVENKSELVKKLGTKQIVFNLKTSISSIPQSLLNSNVTLEQDRLVLTYDSNQEDNGLESMLGILREEKIEFKDIETRESSLEDIFVELVNR